MSTDATFSLNPALKKTTNDDDKIIGRLLLLITAFWWVLTYFVIGPRVFTSWWQRDLLASGPTILIGCLAPRAVKGLWVTAAIVWVVAHLSHDWIFTQIYPGEDTPFATELLTWILCWIPGILAGLSLVAALVLPHAYFASEFVLAFRGIFGLTRWEAIRALLGASYGLQLPYAIVENGQETITKPKGLLDKIGGPGLVVIRPTNAVIYERRGEITQITGPGSTKTKLFEFKKAIIQLRPRWISFDADDIMTRDGIALRMTGGIGAQIEPAERTDYFIKAEKDPMKYRWAWNDPRREEIIPGDFLVYKDSVFRAVYRPAGDNWEQTIKGAALAAIRQAIGRRRLTDIFGDPDEGIAPNAERLIETIQGEAHRQLTSWIHDWGLQVNTVAIATLVPPPEVQASICARWKTATEKANIEQIGAAEAEALRAIEATKKHSFDEMTRALQSAMQRLQHSYGKDASQRLEQTLERIAIGIGHDSLTALRYVEALEKLANHPNARILVAPGSQPVNFDQPK